MSCVSGRRRWLPIPEDGLEEHRQIMEAIKAGNAELAEKLANQHMINAYDNMVKNGLKEIYGESSDEKNKEKVGWQKEQREIVS